MNLTDFENLLEKEGFEMVEDNTDALNYGSKVFKRSNNGEEETVTTNYIEKDEEEK